jgi:IS66 C-terminal element/Transposase IS66 family
VLALQGAAQGLELTLPHTDELFDRCWRKARVVTDVKEDRDPAAERALRVVALGRKNFLFAGSDGGGERAAAVYSLIGTAKLIGIDPESYLRNVLSRISEQLLDHLIFDVIPRVVKTAIER